jgi:hypothetical protein
MSVNEWFKTINFPELLEGIYQDEDGNLVMIHQIYPEFPGWSEEDYSAWELIPGDFMGEVKLKKVRLKETGKQLRRIGKIKKKRIKKRVFKPIILGGGLDGTKL